MALSRILTCDNGGHTAGASPAATGTLARRTDYAGSIRRVKLGRYRFVSKLTGKPGPWKPLNRDLCATCRMQAAFIAAAAGSGLEHAGYEVELS